MLQKEQTDGGSEELVPIEFMQGGDKDTENVREHFNSYFDDKEKHKTENFYAIKTKLVDNKSTQTEVKYAENESSIRKTCDKLERENSELKSAKVKLEKQKLICEDLICDLKQQIENLNTELQKRERDRIKLQVRMNSESECRPKRRKEDKGKSRAPAGSDSSMGEGSEGHESELGHPAMEGKGIGAKGIGGRYGNQLVS